MSDVILIAAIIAFFAAAALVVKFLDRMIEGSRSGTEADDELTEAAELAGATEASGVAGKNTGARA
jgi:hypothetical protein